MSVIALTYWQRRFLREQLANTPDAHTYRRTLALLELDRGRSVVEVADMLGVTRQSVHNWAAAFRRDPVPSALRDEPRTGRPRVLAERTEALVSALLRHSPQNLGHPHTNRTVPLLRHGVERGLGLRPSDDTIRRAPRRLG